MVSWRLERAPVTHGASPAAAASASRHTSPPTMHKPVRTVVDDAGADRRHGERDRRRAGEHGGDDEQQRDVLRRGLTGASMSGHVGR